MKISLTKDRLLDALTNAASVISSKTERAYLTGVKFKAKRDTVTLESTDLNSSIRIREVAMVEEEGEALINARKLTNIVKAMPDGAVFIHVADRKAIVMSGNSSIEIPTFSVSSFPSFPVLDIEDSISLPFNTFIDSVKRVSYAAAKEGNTTPYFVGIFFRVRDSELLIAATDGLRMMKIESPTTLSKEFEGMVPAQALKAIAGLSKSSESIKVGIKRNQAVFEFSNIVFISRRFLETFPKYERLFPSDYQTKIRIKHQDISDAIKRVSAIADGAARIIFKADTVNKKLSIECDCGESGSSSEILFCETIEGKSILFILNRLFLMDALTSHRGESLVITLMEPTEPIIFHSTDDVDAKHLVLPIKPRPEEVF